MNSLAISARGGWSVVAGILVTVAALFLVHHTAAAEEVYSGRTARQWADLLKNGDVNEKLEAAFILGNVGRQEPGVVPDLIAALDDESDLVRAEVAKALDEFGCAARPAVPKLLQLSRDADPHVRSASLTALALLSDARNTAEVMPVVLRGLQDEEWNVRSAALGAVQRLGPPASAAVDRLIELLDSRRDGHGAAYALAAIGPAAERAVPRLIEALNDPDWTKPPPVTPPDLPVPVATHDRSRVSPIAALGGIGPAARQAVPTLRAVLKEDDAWRRVHAAQALWQIAADEAAADELVAALRDDKAVVRRRAADILAEIPQRAAESVPALIDCLTHEDAYVRSDAAVALGRLGKPARRAVPELVGAMDADKSPGVRVRAAQALWHIERRASALRLLVAALRGEAVENRPVQPDERASRWIENLTAREWAVEALREIGPAARGIAPELQAALNSDRQEVRQAAADALEKVTAGDN